MNTNNELLTHLAKLHTTKLGIIRIKRNPALDTNDLVNWYKSKINSPGAIIIAHKEKQNRHYLYIR